MENTALPEMDPRPTVKIIWENLRACHKFMLTGFPTLWDAYWYGSLSTIFEQMCLELGEKEVGNIVGKKQLKRFLEEQESMLDDIYYASHRDEMDDIPKSPLLFKFPK